jgi:hypothetical protein
MMHKNMDDEDDQEEGKKDDGCNARGERSGGRRGRWEGEKAKDGEEDTGTCIMSSFRSHV